MKRWLVIAIAAVLLVGVGPARGYIEALYTFQQVLNESTYIHVGKVEKVDLKQKTLLAVVDRAIKPAGGKVEFKKVMMNIGSGPGPHADYLMERFKAGDDFVLFSNGGACEAYTGDVWFQLYPQPNPNPADKETAWWRMNHVEIRLNRTYNGTTTDLIKLTEDVLAKKVPAPAPDPSIPPIDVDRTARRIELPVPKGKSGGYYRQIQFAHPGGAELRGIAFADLRATGLLDVLLSRQGGVVLLVNQGGGNFQDQTSRWALAGPTRSAVAADFAGDGKPGVFTSNFQLLTNTGVLFRDEKAFPAPPERAAEGVAWLDYNGDGLPDALVANGPFGLRLFENIGRGPKWFGDVSERAGLGPKGLGVPPAAGTPAAAVPGAGPGNFLACFDYDNDGRIDFLYNFGDGLLVHNNGDGAFAVDTRAGITLPGGSGYKRGVAVADYDNDGCLDLFVPGPARPKLYHNNNDGTFTDMIDSADDLGKLAEPNFSACWGDVNGDGNPDLVVCCPNGQIRLYLGDGHGHFTDVTDAIGLKGVVGAQAAAFADLRNEGKLDLVISLPDRILVCFNEIPRSAARGALTVELKARRGAAGAVARAMDERGRLLGMRHLGCADNCGGQTPPVGYFALPIGTARVCACLTDGRAAIKDVPISATPARLTFDEADFK